MDYASRFIKVLWQDAKPWARDNIGWSLVIAIAPPLTAYFRDRHAVDWKMFWTTTKIYAFAALIYLLCFRTASKLDAERVKLIGELKTQLGSSVVITDLQDGDPRIEPAFVDGRKSLEGVELLELKNRGSGIAYAIRINPLKLRKRTVYFPTVSESIHPTDFRHFFAEVGDQWGYDRNRNLIQAMSEEWSSYEDSDTRREICIPARVDFENNEGVRFECNFMLLYHGGRGWNQPADFKCIECRNFTYRRIPLGVTPVH
jgi:hypothetical protein